MWQHALFGSKWKAGPTNKLQCLLQSKQPVMIVSDTSVQKNGQSGFAWIIANDHVILWHGHGLAPGPINDTYSGRTEAYGILAALTFLCFYLNCYVHQVPSQLITCYCNNSRVDTNLMSMKECVIVCPNDTTNNDHNLYAAITAEAAKMLAITHSIHSHQGSPR